MDAAIPCSICGSNAWTLSYAGPLRDGAFGRECEGRILRCGGCSVEMLQSPRRITSEYYADGTYRSDVGEEADPRHFFASHDHEQFTRFPLLERLSVRNRVVADVGCGGGSFLDGVRGFASATVAIEPTINYHTSLAQRGHRVFSDTRTSLVEFRGKVDLATCFSVIEHLEDPVALLSEIRELLSPDGVALISTPNREDILMAAGSDAYRRFFYRVVHLWYFDSGSLKQAAGRAGFTRCDVVYRHRFPFSNFVGWLRDNRPSGSQQQALLGSSFDQIWHASLEASGHSDYLYAYLSGH